MAKSGAASNVAASVVIVEGTQFKNNGVMEFSEPYQVEVAVQGVAPLLCHRYDIDVVAGKGAAPKGSKDKKTDNVESYVYRLANGECGIPGDMFKASLCASAKFNKDPRSPRKSAYDLFRAGVVVPGIASLGKKTWDYLDVRPVVVNMARVPRSRPAFNQGWKLVFTIEVLLPEYITPALLNEVVTRAGRICGIGDYRPDFGRFMIERFENI